MSNQNNEKEKIEVDAAFIEEFAQTKEALANVVEEIKDLRTSKNEEIEELKKKIKEDGDSNDNDDSKKLEKLLDEREKREIEQNFQSALESFKISNSSFNPSNDVGGIKFKAFEKELSKFNLSNLKTKEDFSSRLKEVYSFMNRNTPKKEEGDDFTSSFASTSKSQMDVNTLDDVQLTDKEKKLLKFNNLDIQAYIKMREKRPAYVNSLLKFID